MAAEAQYNSVMRPASPPGTDGLLPFLLIALAFVFGACGDGPSGPGATGTSGSRSTDAGSEGAGSPAAEPTNIGTFEDVSDFRGFGEEISEALEQQDISFFVDIVALEDVSCEENLPAPPESCAGAAPGATIPAVLLSVWEAEDAYLDGEQYREFMTEFLSEYAEGESDSYGDGAPQLYAYAIIDPDVRSSREDGETVEAIVTRIVRTGTGAEREALLITSTFDGERWTVSRLTKGPATFLDPSGPQSADAGDDGVFEFWSRWQE